MTVTSLLLIRRIPYRIKINAKVNRTQLLRTETSTVDLHHRRLFSHSSVTNDFTSSNTSSTVATDELSVNQTKNPSSKKKKQTKVGALAELAKFRLSALVVSTAAAGFVAAGPHALLCNSEFWFCLAGTALCSSSAAALNQIYERDRDAKMKRTIQRPLVTGVLTSTEAMAAATVWGTTGTGLLWYCTNPTTALLGAANIGLYAGLYTYLKPISTTNTWVGAVVGAIPPLMGYAAATGGTLDATAALLGTTLYLWQMPHFFALSYMHRVDYARGGFQMMPVVDEPETARLVLRYTAYLSTLPFVATACQMTNSMFALEGIALNAYAYKVANDFYQDPSNGGARTVFLTSLWYLPCWMTLFLLHSKVWDEDQESQKDDVVVQLLRYAVHAVRNKGRDLCVHEQVVAKSSTTGQEACPVTVTKRETNKAIDQTIAAATAEPQTNKHQ